MATPAPACTVYFDGACPLCRREIAHYRSQAGAASMAWVDVAGGDAAALGAGLSRDAALARLHVRQQDGSLVSGAAAFAAIWSQLPAYGWLARLASRRSVLGLMNVAYSGFLRLRPLWRRGQAPASALPQSVLAILRTDYVGEVGVVQLHRGILAVARDGTVRAFASGRLATGLLQEQRLRRALPAAARSRLLPLARAAGWLAGAVAALLGPRAVFAAAAAVERLIDRRYAGQIEQLSRLPELAEPRAMLAACRRREREPRHGAAVGHDEHAGAPSRSADRRACSVRRGGELALVQPLRSAPLMEPQP